MRWKTNAQGFAEDRRLFIINSLTCWAVTAALLVFLTCFLAEAPIEIRGTRLPLNALTFAVFGAVAVFYTYARFEAQVAAICDAVAVLSLFTMLAAIYTYVMTYLGRDVAFWDPTLLSVDRALGFSWKGYLSWVNEHALVGWVLNQAYLSILLQVPALIVSLTFAKQQQRLQVFVLASQLSLILCGAAPAVLPALGAYPFLGISAALDHPNVALATMDAHVEQVMQLRGDTPVLPIESIEGIVVFPSFHMVLAVLFIWSFWRVPVVRWVALALNLLMIAATPLSGGHYLVDLGSGSVLAVLMIATASWLQTVIRRQIAASNPGSPSAVAVPGALIQAYDTGTGVTV